MKAIVWTAYGPPGVLRLKEIEKPVPKNNEVLVKVRATTVTSGDCEQRALKLPLWYRLIMQVYIGLLRPSRITILGMDLAGEVEAVGRDVGKFKAGDQVFGATGFIHMGACAEYICLPEEPEDGALAMMPANMTYEEAAAVPVGGLEALNFLRQGNVQGGENVLINGAGGTIGPFAIQLAKHFGAEVTGVDSADKLEILRAVGADQVIDFTREDFTESGGPYDLILDLVGKRSLSDNVRQLNRNGRYLIANPGLSQMIRGRWRSIAGSKQVLFGNAQPNSEDLNYLGALIEADRLRSVIDRRFTLEQTADAHRYVETGRKKGQVVVTVHGERSSPAERRYGAITQYRLL